METKKLLLRSKFQRNCIRKDQNAGRKEAKSIKDCILGSLDEKIPRLAGTGRKMNGAGWC